MAPTVKKLMDEAAKLYAGLEEWGLNQLFAPTLKPLQRDNKKEMCGRKRKEPIS